MTQKNLKKKKEKRVSRGESRALPDQAGESEPSSYPQLRKAGEKKSGANPKPKRLNAIMSRARFEAIEEVLTKYELSVSEALRMGLNIVAAALPVLARGGKIIFREENQDELAFYFPELIRKVESPAITQANLNHRDAGGEKNEP